MNKEGGDRAYIAANPRGQSQRPVPVRHLCSQGEEGKPQQGSPRESKQYGNTEAPAGHVHPVAVNISRGAQFPVALSL